MSQMPVKIAVIGAGYFSHFHLEAWNRLEGAYLCAICDQAEDQARKKANEFNIPKAYKEVEEMLLLEKPDAVDIITPPHTHLELCKIAAQHGCHIICQKPLSPNLDEAYQMARIAKKKWPAFHGARKFSLSALV